MLLVGFLDELASGIAPASTPDIAQLFGLSGGTAAGAMIVAFHSLAFFLETPLLAWSERVRPRWFSAGSLAVVALSSFLAAFLPRGWGAWGLFVALAIYGPASGCALATSEGLLVEADPSTREKTMARLSLAANAGDLAVPALLALLAYLGLGFRAGFFVAGVLAVLLAISHASARSLDQISIAGSLEEGDHDEQQEGPAPTIREALRFAISHRPLLGWSLVCATTGLLDEVLVAFSALHLQAMGASPTERSWAIGAWVVGGFFGLFALERWVVESNARRTLLFASIVALLGVLLLAVTHAPLVGALALFVIGVSGSTLHPLTKARAYAALPHRPALVNAVTALLLPFDMGVPVLLGLLATHAGPAYAIVGLASAPIAVTMAALRADRESRSR